MLYSLIIGRSCRFHGSEADASSELDEDPKESRRHLCRRSEETRSKCAQLPNTSWDPPTNITQAAPGPVHSIGTPIQVYPLYENGLRAHLGQSISENNQESAQLYAEFAKVAAQNPYAWSFGKETETKDSIGTVTRKNRMICFPC